MDARDRRRRLLDWYLAIYGLRDGWQAQFEVSLERPSIAQVWYLHRTTCHPGFWESNRRIDVSVSLSLVPRVYSLLDGCGWENFAEEDDVARPWSMCKAKGEICLGGALAGYVVCMMLAAPDLVRAIKAVLWYVLHDKDLIRRNTGEPAETQKGYAASALIHIVSSSNAY